MRPATAPKRVLVTGASGFIGRAVVDLLSARGIPVRRAVRTLESDDSIDTVLVGAIDASTFNARSCDCGDRSGNSRTRST